MNRKEVLKKVARSLIPNLGTVVIVIALLWAQQTGAMGLLSPDASSTTTISYQGRLADSGGNPVTDTPGMTFRIYNAATGGSALWTETYPAVQISDGLFHILLGSTTPLPNSLFSDNATLYLGITVGADSEMTPREQLASAPWAMTVPDGSITTAKIADGAINQDKAPFAVQHYRGTTLRQNAKVSTGTYVVGLNGGSLEEFVSIDITDLEFGGTPTGIAQFVNNATANPTHLIFARYNWDGSSSTSASIRVSRVDGQPLSTGAIRVDLILWSP